MGKIQSIIFTIVCAWGALANAMPGIFQVSPEKKLMKLGWGPKSGPIAMLIAGCVLGWYMWTTDRRISDLASHLSAAPVAAGPTDEMAMKLVGWGANPDNSNCAATIDASKLSPKSKEIFDIVLICGSSDPSIDWMKDTRITVSRLFTPEDTVSIETPFSDNMTQGISKRQKEAIDKMVPRPKQGTLVNIQLSIWVRAALLPKGFDTSNIHSLSDIPASGGHIAYEGAEAKVSKQASVE